MSYAARKRRKNTLLLTISFLVIGAAALFIIRDTADFFVKKQAEDVATIVGTFAKTARSVYSQKVIRKLKEEGFGASVDYKSHQGYVPIPAQFLKMLGQATADSSSHLFHYKPVSKWNIEPTQGISNDFLQWAWPQLQAQDQTNPQGPINWKPISRIEEYSGERVLRFLSADPATSSSCVNCHNSYETSPAVLQQRKKNGVPLGKQWKQHQLLGALEITIPLDRIEIMAAEEIRRTTLWISAILVGCLLLVIGIYLFNAGQRRNIANLSWQANHDALTKLANRRGFERSVNLMWEISQHEKKEHALILIDLDGFKAVNDTHGHQAGDDILIEVAKQINTHRRANDTVARIGGDEFAILLPSCPVDRAYTIAESIRQQITEISVDRKGHTLSVGASIGLAMIDGKRESVQQTIEAADAACYLAKKEGKNKVVISES